MEINWEQQLLIYKYMFKIITFSIILLILLFFNSYSIPVNMIVYSLAIIPLAIFLGEFTSAISEYIGEKKGGLLAATVGNIPELLIGISSIRYGMIPMIKSALIGSVINNMLLVLGISVFLGGVKYREQSFNKLVARTNFSMLLLAMSAMIVMASVNRYSVLTNDILISISLIVALVLIFVYVLGLIFSLYTHGNLFVISEYGEESSNNTMRNCRKFMAGIIVTSIMLYFISDKLIFNISGLIAKYKISQEFFGIVFIPILGNIGENLSAILSSLKNKVNLSLEIAIGSSIQIVLFVAPLLIILSYFTLSPMNFLFTMFQIIITAIAICMSFFVFQDGKTYWLEGAILIAIYIMIITAYYHI